MRGWIFSVAGVIFLLSSLCSCRQNKKTQNTIQIEHDTFVPPELLLKYGFPVDSFLTVEGRVNTNQYLSQILNEFGVGMEAIDRIARNSISVFDVRKIRSGQNYTIFQTPDSLNEARYFVYENSATEYYVFE